MLSDRQEAPYAPEESAFLIAGLRGFIKKNTAIPAFFARVKGDSSLHAPLLEQLITAIEQADISHDIFAHPDCMAYLLYIIENMSERLPFWSAVTAYHYLVALAQFTHKQDLKPQDMTEVKHINNVKNIRNVNMVSVVDRDLNALNDVGIQYFQHVKFQFKRLGIAVDEEDFKEYILALPPIEQCVLRVTNYEANIKIYQVDEFMWKVRENVPFFRDLNKSIFNLPSASLINYFLSCLSPHPIRMRPVFGKISLASLHDVHLQRQHPVTWYSTLVKDTLIDVHDYHCGPFVVLVHDVGHCFWGSWMSCEDRAIINHILIPKLQELKSLHQHFAMTSALDVLCSSLTDYDLTPAMTYSNPATRFALYVGMCLKKAFNLSNAFQLDHEHMTSVIVLIRDLAVENIKHDTVHQSWYCLSKQIDKNYKHILRPLVPEEDLDLKLVARTATEVLELVFSQDEQSAAKEAAEPEQKKLKPGL